MSPAHSTDGIVPLPPPGVYRASRQPALDDFGPDAWDIAPIALDRIDAAEALFERFATALDFPDWFGRNWDALADCLGDLSWRMPAPHVLILLRADVLQARSAVLFDALCSVLEDATRVPADPRAPLYAVFVDPQARLTCPVWPRSARV